MEKPEKQVNLIAPSHLISSFIFPLNVTAITSRFARDATDCAQPTMFDGSLLGFSNFLHVSSCFCFLPSGVYQPQKLRCCTCRRWRKWKATDRKAIKPRCVHGNPFWLKVIWILPPYAFYPFHFTPTGQHRHRCDAGILPRRHLR